MGNDRGGALRDAGADGFYGEIICEKGIHSGKAFEMDPGELVSLGSEDGSDIKIIGALDKKIHCLISYDDESGEYVVQPLYRRAVFLESGQPLGKERHYCFPRGVILVVDSGRNRFRLG